jgi:hypothetical protein
MMKKFSCASVIVFQNEEFVSNNGCLTRDINFAAIIPDNIAMTACDKWNKEENSNNYSWKYLKDISQ